MAMSKTNGRDSADLSRDVTVGNTPLVALGGDLDVRAKLEWMNPFGSIKDRAAFWMIKEALQSGMLDRGKVIIEPSSGNMGIALSSLAKKCGLRAQIVVPEKVSEETKGLLRELGAEVFETADDLCPRVGKGTDQCIALAKSYRDAHPHLYFMPNQYENAANFRAHYNTTGPEVWRDTGGKVDAFIAGIGTGGTITGVAKYLKERRNVRVIAVQPQPNHKIQGLRNISESAMPAVLERGKDLVDDWVTVSNEEAFDAVKKLALRFDLYAGPSSGAVYAAVERLEDSLRGKRVVVMFADSGLKYRSVYFDNDVFTQREMDAIVQRARFSELKENSANPAIRLARRAE
jgi:cysteine synthase B